MASVENTTTAASPASSAPAGSALVATVPPASVPAVAGKAELATPAQREAVEIETFEEFASFSQPQRKALSALIDGKPINYAAFVAGVTRMTIYRWQRCDPNFANALKLYREQARETFRIRMANMHEKAMTALETLVEKGDFRSVKLVVDFLKKGG